MDATESHVKQITKALEQGQKLTGMDILLKFDCMNYKGRIHDIRRKGLPVRTTMCETQSGKRIAVYSLEKAS